MNYNEKKNPVFLSPSLIMTHKKNIHTKKKEKENNDKKHLTQTHKRN